MSDNSQTAQLIEEYSTLQMEHYASTAILCLLAYEYMITFDRETKFFWKRSITGSSVLFIVNRPHYNQVSSMGFVLHSEGICTELRNQRAMVYIDIGPAFFSCTLDHQLYCRLNWVIGQLWEPLMGVSSMTFACNYPNSGCLIISDLLVMCITWKATYKTSRDIKVLGRELPSQASCLEMLYLSS
ncbi:hypothetical protein C8Q74DRAFT_1221923, partial [Fomes fomentarius]